MSTELDNITRVLTSYTGRDKALRTLCFMLHVRAQSGSPLKDQLIGLAKQISNARLCMRQFNHPSMFKACQHLIQNSSKPADVVDFTCHSTITGVYTVYGFVELAAWLADAKLIKIDSAPLWRWCLYLWTAALITGIFRCIRSIYKKSQEMKAHMAKEDIVTLVGLTSDFASAINSLPFKFLWAGKLTPRQSATFSLIASFIGLYKVC
ncbi:unnamed protein product [Auanema sp. JU1783]|nr:unnamed protein product [Auanema sp. JU1783]